MAKKKKVVIVDQELTPTVLAELNNQKGNLIPLFLLVFIFGAVIIFLPDISDFVNTYFSSSPSYVSKPADDDKDKHPTEDALEVVKYDASPDLVIPGNNFDLGNFTIDGGNLNFVINNTGNSNLNFNNYNYYLGIYNSNNTLLQRIKIEDITVTSGDTKLVSYALNNGSIYYYTFMEIKEEDFPTFDATTNFENGYGELTCQKDNETVKYSFNDNLVYAINDTFIVDLSDPSYATYYANYQSLAATYNTKSGLKSELKVEGSELVFATEMDLNSYDNTPIGKIVYPKDTNAKVIHFELLSRGYTCLE